MPGHQPPVSGPARGANLPACSRQRGLATDWHRCPRGTPETTAANAKAPNDWPEHWEGRAKDDVLRVLYSRAQAVVVDVPQPGSSRILGVMSDPQTGHGGPDHTHGHVHASRPGLRLGADDYVVRPFSPLELAARVDAVLRRARPGGADGLLSFGAGGLVIDQAGRSPRPSHPCRTGMNTRTDPNNRSTEPAVSAGQGFLQRIRFASCLMIGETVPATDVSANLRHRRRQRLQTLRGDTYQAELRHFADMIRPWGDQLKK